MKKTRVIGDWVVQWDTEYQQWFYYNQVSEDSTWDRPRELEQFDFLPPGDYENSHLARNYLKQNQVVAGPFPAFNTNNINSVTTATPALVTTTPGTTTTTTAGR